MLSKKLSCLYVEDDALSREVMQVMITQLLGSDLTVFENSENFLERARALPAVPDVIFLDVHIGPHDGYEMLEMLKNDPAFTSSTIIAMTASVMTYDVERLREAGFHGLIAKPLRKRVFPELMQRLLNGESIWFTS